MIRFREKLGRITQKVEIIHGTTHSYDYAYDLGERLESVSLDGSALASWTWDANGNRLSATTPSGTTSCVYDEQDRLASCGQVTFTRNLSGQLTERSDATAGTTTQYQYDMFGNLRHVELADGTQVDYLIDNLNRRIGKKVNGSLVRGLLYPGDLQPVAELDVAGNIVSTFVYAARSHVPSYMLKGGQVYRIISDHLGSPRLVVNAASGTVAQRMDYDAWGKVILDTNPGFQPFGFAGGLYDRDTGLVRFGARDYNPATGRWTTKDPILFNGGDTNLYGYVVADPVGNIDPSGLWSFSFDLYAGLGGGFTIGRDPDSGQWFYGGRLGFGLGGGGSFDYEGRRPGSDGPDCLHGTSWGNFIMAGGEVGPYQLNVMDAHGCYDSTDGKGYSEGPGGDLTFGNGAGVHLGGAFGIEVIGH